MAIGIGSGSRHSGEPYPCGSPKYNKLNPSPYKFKIEHMETIGFHTILLVKYEDAFNYDGLKILVYKTSNEANEDLIKCMFRDMKIIDPHFIENEFSPIARFVPTKSGLSMARHFCKAMMVYSETSNDIDSM